MDRWSVTLIRMISHLVSTHYGSCLRLVAVHIQAMSCSLKFHTEDFIYRLCDSECCVKALSLCGLISVHEEAMRCACATFFHQQKG